MAATARVGTTQATPKAADFEPIINKYTKARGEPQMFELFCSKCSALVIIYQKDGKGNLLRCYFDRIHHPASLPDQKTLSCSNCKQVIGTKMVYKQENRDAFRMIRGTYYRG